MVVVVKNFSVARELKVASNSKTQEVAMLDDHLELKSSAGEEARTHANFLNLFVSQSSLLT